ncbi:MAG: pantetheine-phosphate adenylyltransferase [Clostridia bacterium]|nr:pantetheine-phosphate adenylyltransferase [Clostridia bacterium]
MMSVILPGSYDPVTLGHVDVIRRAAEMYDEVYAVIFVNPEKSYRFTLDDRVRMLMLATDELDNVLVSYSNGLVVDYMREHGIEKIVKGYRNGTDLEYERRQAEYNFAHGGYETELLECSPELEGISSTLARKMLEEGKSLAGIVPTAVEEYIERIKE